MLKAIIIDDEQRSRTLLQALLTEYCPNIEIQAQADDVPSGVKAIHKHRPDVVFLDIEMPGYTGFELLDFFDEIDFEIVFTTAYREYALQAFQASAIDYLLKPLQIKQLIKAVEKVEKKLEATSTQERLQTLKGNLKVEGNITRIALPVSDGLLFVDLKDIMYVEADRAYCKFLMVDGNSLLVSKNLKEFEKVLTLPQFFRTHRSYIINLSHVRQYVKRDGGYIIMENGDTVGITRDRKEDFIRACSELPNL